MLKRILKVEEIQDQSSSIIYARLTNLIETRTFYIVGQLNPKLVNAK
jgi:hypothetical protein